MPKTFWNNPNDERYVKAKAKYLLELLEDKEIHEDNPWTNLKTVQNELEIPEFEAIGIIMYMYFTDQIRVRPDDNGDLTIVRVEK